MNEVEIIPTVVADNLEQLRERAARIAEFAPSVHIDVDDGIFTPHISWPFESAGEYSAIEQLHLQPITVHVHLMVQSPREIGIAFAHAAVHTIIGHIEAFSDTEETQSALQAWREAGAQNVGLALLIDTPLEMLDPLVSFCDCIQLMTIATIGQQGAVFEGRSIERVKALHTRYPDLSIGVDGGVNESNIAALARAGATEFAIGSAISRSTDSAAAFNRLLAILE